MVTICVQLHHWKVIGSTGLAPSCMLALFPGPIGRGLGMRLPVCDLMFDLIMSCLQNPGHQSASRMSLLHNTNDFHAAIGDK